MPANPEPSQPLTKPPTSIRVAKIGDLAAILAIEQSSPRAAHWSPDHYQDRIQSQPHGACFLIAESEAEGGVEAQAEGKGTGRVPGFLCARVIGSTGEWE